MRCRRPKKRQQAEGEVALGIARQLCAGLTQAHQQKVIVGDLKLGDVLLAKGDWAVLTGFGLALEVLGWRENSIEAMGAQRRDSRKSWVDSRTGRHRGRISDFCKGWVNGDVVLRYDPKGFGPVEKKVAVKNGDTITFCLR